VPSGRGRASVRFDESAFEDDVARLSARGREIVARARKEFEREGVSLSRLLACHEEHESGTSLPGCMKVYVPDAHGQWRIIFQIAAGDAGLLLSYLAAGVGHQPRGAGAPDAYQLAHHRLHGRWPRRRRE
jgi:hypothetical protein